MARPRVAEEIRFWAKVNKTDTCWLWTGTPDKDGYGRFKAWVYGEWKNIRAHVWAWQEVNGPVPEGLVLDHRVCSVPACVRPDHLLACTSAENTHRYFSEERTFCTNNHPLTQFGPCDKCAKARRYRHYYKNVEASRKYSRERKQKKVLDR